MTPPYDRNVVVELERLRGVCSSGFAEINGRLAVMAEKSEGVEEDVEKHDTRISTLERRLWMLAGAASVFGMTGSTVFSALTGGTT